MFDSETMDHVLSNVRNAPTGSEGEDDLRHRRRSSSVGEKPTSSLTKNKNSMRDISSDSDSRSREQDEEYELHDDVYTMVFLSNPAGPAFWFGFCIFVLKILLYVFIGIDLYQQDISFDTQSELVRAAQFFMLPVALAIQQDLIATYALIANIRYDKAIQNKCRGATLSKWVLGSSMRCVDGVASLALNFIIMLQTTDVLSLFLNFAALQFLQTIDNVAFHLAAEGYLSDRIQTVANEAKTLTLPQKHDRIVNAMDSCLFLLTYTSMLAAWIVVTVM